MFLNLIWNRLILVELFMIVPNQNSLLFLFKYFFLYSTIFNSVTNLLELYILYG